MGNKFTFKQAIFAAIGIIAAISMIKIMGIDPTNPGSWKKEFTELGATTKEKITSIFSSDGVNISTGNNNGNSSGGSSNTNDKDQNTSTNEEDENTSSEKENSSSYVAILDTLTVSTANNVDYDRDEWRHWDGYGKSCWNIREETLYRQNTGNIVLLDKNKNTTTNKDDACYISEGKWEDPYTNETFTNPSDLDIDHMIPLGYAARHGGQEWSKEEKSEYANSLNDNHLLAVSASANRSKSDKGPSEWKPVESYQCQYAENWIDISDTWGLSVTEADKKALEEMLSTC